MLVDAKVLGELAQRSASVNILHALRGPAHPELADRITRMDNYYWRERRRAGWLQPREGSRALMP
jgi:hypothetical protein